MTTNAATQSDQLIQAYSTKEDAYYSGARADFVALLPFDCSASILEVGCGTGATGELALASGRAGRYIGVELMEAAAAQANKSLTDVRVGNVERMQFNWQPSSFDALILSEVLEHLVDPEAVLKKLAVHIRPGGKVLASSPNISHWRVLRELALGHFPTADKGVFDRTHLRWFTPETFASMFERTGFSVDAVRPVTPFSDRTNLISQMTRGRFDHLFMTQIAIEATRR